jgi:pyruvate,orthophosphate dikinase
MEQNVLSLFQIGLKHETVAALVQNSETPKFFWMLYLRWIQRYATAYLRFDSEKLAEPVSALLAEKNVQAEADLDLDDVIALCNSLKELLEAEETPFPQDPLVQLKAAIEKVLLSWNSEAAVEFKRAHEVPPEASIAVCVTIHVWTNLGDTCAIGSTLTRNPANGDSAMVGNYVLNVTGTEYLAKTKPAQPIRSLEGANQPAYEKLINMSKTIKKYYKLPAEVDFIIENANVDLLS